MFHMSLFGQFLNPQKGIISIKLVRSSQKWYHLKGICKFLTDKEQYQSNGVDFMPQSMRYSLKMPFFGIFRPTSKFKMAAHYCCFEIFSKFLHRCAQKALNFQKNYRPKWFLNLWEKIAIWSPPPTKNNVLMVHFHVTQHGIMLFILYRNQLKQWKHAINLANIYQKRFLSVIYWFIFRK